MLISSVTCIPPLVSKPGPNNWQVVLELDGFEPQTLVMVHKESLLDSIQILNLTDHSMAAESDYFYLTVPAHQRLLIKKPMTIMLGIFLRAMAIDSFTVEISKGG